LAVSRHGAFALAGTEACSFATRCWAASFALLHPLRWARSFTLSRRSLTDNRVGCAGLDLATSFLLLGGSRRFLGGAELFGFFGSFLRGCLFFEAALLGFERTLLFLGLPDRLYSLAFFSFRLLPLPGLKERACTGVNLSCRELTQHLLLALIRLRCLLRSWLLERLVLWLLWLGGGLWPDFLYNAAMASDRALAFGLDKNRFRAPMTEVLADVALFHRPLYIQRHGPATADCLVFRLFRFAHSLPWHGEVSSSPVQ
jgi:hypothetical protein